MTTLATAQIVEHRMTEPVNNYQNTVDYFYEEIVKGLTDSEFYALQYCATEKMNALDQSDIKHTSIEDIAKHYANVEAKAFLTIHQQKAA
ncbi:hypothetical protein [Paraglaciecola sp.]|uniref:hypothetical protein n=1 Tax=Paraglaciecola sp. TaxID=1920173 RepID=UPI003EF2D9F9